MTHIARPFAIGLEPLDLVDWFVIGDDLADILREKHRLETLHGDRVFMAEAETEDAQHEVLDRIAAHLAQHHPDLYQPEDNALTIVPTGERVALQADDEPALKRAAHLVPDDLVIIRNGGNGWRLAAASVCFPSSWTLAEKFAHPLDAVHGPVPGFASGTRNAGLITRIFDNLRPDMPVRRGNWSLYHDDALYHPAAHGADHIDPRRLTGSLYLRRERQTLHKLPQSGDILFTIRILVDPLDEIASTGNGAETLGQLRAEIATMTPQQLAYKGLAGARDAVLDHLQMLGRGVQSA